MVVAHVLDERGSDGSLTWVAWLVTGRASALFAVLAGVSLVLMSRRASAPALAVRAVLVAALGLALGELETGLAIILTYYGVLFLLGLPFLRLPARTLFLWAGAWVVVAPVVSQAVRPHLPPRGAASPAFDHLGNPGHLLSELLVTGYYPCLTWLAYLLLGMAIGRCDLRSRSVHTGLGVGGLAVATLAFLVSRALTQQPWVLRRLVPDAGRYGDVSTADAFVNAIGAGMHGTTPAGGSWAWLLVVAPHSGTPFDLLETGASAALVIGLCLLAVAGLPAGGRRAVAIAFGAGTMTLTLYSLHVVMRTDRVWPAEEPTSLDWHLLVLLAVGGAFVAVRWRGPLEALVGRVSAFATRWPGRCPSPSALPPPRSARTPRRR
jgi:uncharacterized membrane protein YeiB